MRYLSLFTGIGGFELGITQAYETKIRETAVSTADRRGGDNTDSDVGRERTFEGSELLCIGFSEIDKYAVQIYQSHFSEHKNYGDITKINETELPDFDLLVGGFPCQAFSIAGKRGGFADTRGTLFFDIARILKAKQPRLLLLENVKGLLSHDEGRTFATIISTLDELGYDLQWQVLNSKNFGVPQNRERVFIVGHLRGTSRPQVFPFGKPDKEDIVSGGFHEGNEGRDSSSKDGQKEVEYSGDAHNETSREGSRHECSAPTISKTVRSGGRNSPHDSKQNWDSYEFGGQIRRLTPTECERLQGFPDGWTGGVSDTQRYKCLGNAVTVNVIREIIKRI